MGQKKSAAVKRGAKKHEKAKKRQKKLEGRQRAAAPSTRRPEDAWRPAEEGIEGLATRLKRTVHEASLLAEALGEANRHADARICWLPARVHAMSTEQILAELASRGVHASEAEFSVLAERHPSARTLARAAWVPALPPDATPHDRDLLGQASEELWKRWRPDLVSDEDLGDRILVAAGREIQADPEEHLDDLLAFWDTVRPLGGLSRLRQAGLDEVFLELLRESLPYEVDEEDEALVRQLVEIIAQLPDDSDHRSALESTVWDGTADPTVREALLDGHLAVGHLNPGSPRLRLAADLVLYSPHATPEQTARVIDELRSALAQEGSLTRIDTGVLQHLLTALEDDQNASEEDPF